MIFQRFACEPLAQAGYVIGHGGEALVVDPRRDVDDVLAFLAAKGLRVVRVIATHVHADFVAGLHEIATATGAPIALGEGFAGSLPVLRLAHGQTLRLGDLHVDVLATPGHTLESVSLRVHGDATQPDRLLTGDALFVGDVGRPDLAQGAGIAPRAMAERLFVSLHERLAGLPDATEVWPAHGAGSACGSCIGTAVSSTLGAERADNWAFRTADREAFVTRLLGSLRPPPPHFARLVAENHRAPALLASLPVPPTLPAAAATAGCAGAIVLDVRSWASHGRGHWPGAVNIGLDGGEFEPWAGALLPADRPLLVHAESPARALEARRRLARVGLDEVCGFVLELPATAARTPQLDALDLFAPTGNSPWQVVDVRRPEEFAAGHVPGAVHVELSAAMTPPVALDRGRPTAVLCEGGYRSSAAIARLRELGYQALHNVHDGMRGWRQNHLPQERGPTATS